MPDPFAGSRPRHGIYMSSKVRHAARWRDLRGTMPIVSTWIDDPDDISLLDWPDLWRRCISEASNAKVLVVFHEPDIILKGAWIEVGAALGAGVPVLGVGIEHYTIGSSGLVRHFPDLESALAEAGRIASAQEAEVDGTSLGRMVHEAEHAGSASAPAWDDISDDGKAAAIRIGEALFRAGAASVRP